MATEFNYYIGCQNSPNEVTHATGNLIYQCWQAPAVADGTLFTLQEIQDQFSPPMTADDGFVFATVIFTCSMLAWGFRLALKQYNIGV